MALNFDSLRTIIERVRSDIRNYLPGSDPTIVGSFLRAIADSLSGRIYDLQLLLQQVLDQAFPQTATGIYLGRWGQYQGLSQLPATVSSGQIVITGIAGSVVPTNTLFTNAEGLQFEVQLGVSLVLNTFVITTITRSGSTATATRAGHNLATGMTINISGAVETEYNGSFVVTVIDADTFSYTVSGTPATPATGTISGSFTGAIATVESVDAGQSSNLDSGGVLTISETLTGVNSLAYVRLDGLTGGADEETEDAFRERILRARANPVANFNPAAIEKKALEISGVTRVFIKIVTPSVGDVTIYFLRDNDINPIPSATEITKVRDSILTLLPATSDPSNVYVLAPTPVVTNFTFSAISPDTPTMRAAIIANLEAFYQDTIKFETTITTDKYRAAIIETQDTETGEFLDSFTLTTPSANITIGSGEIGRLGTVSFT